MTLAEFVQSITDKRLPQFDGAGVQRGVQVHFGKGKGHLYLSQTLYVTKSEKGKVLIRNTAY